MHGRGTLLSPVYTDEQVFLYQFPLSLTSSACMYGEKRESFSLSGALFRRYTRVSLRTKKMCTAAGENLKSVQ
jgi:hypothetical protein